MDITSLCEVEVAYEARDGNSAEYRLKHCPPFYPYTTETGPQDHIMLAWFLHATTVLESAKLPLEPGTTELFARVDEVILALRARSDPILAPLTRWVPGIWKVAAEINGVPKKCE